MARRYPPEFHAFMREFIPGHTELEIQEECRRRGYELTLAAINSYKANHHIKSGTPVGNKKGTLRKYPAEIIEFIISNHKGIGPKQMTSLVNEKFGTAYTNNQIKGIYGNRRLNSGVTGYFEKGKAAFNKGKKQSEFMSPEAIERTKSTRFHKGHLPPNTKPVGYERINVNGYIEVKIKMRPSHPSCNDNFVPKHRLVWEQANGPIPEGHIITFKDGNKLNTDLENLMLISQADNAVMNKCGLRTTDPEAAESAVLISKVKRKQYELKRKLKKQSKRQS